MERVNTGGLVNFQYPRGYNPHLTPEEEADFAETWEKVEERRKKRRFYLKIGFWIIMGLILFISYKIMVKIYFK